MLSQGLIQPSDKAVDAPTNAPCTDEEHEAMRSKTIRFF
jgi:monothiol glutaredoxin